MKLQKILWLYALYMCMKVHNEYDVHYVCLCKFIKSVTALCAFLVIVRSIHYAESIQCISQVWYFQKQLLISEEDHP